MTDRHNVVVIAKLSLKEEMLPKLDAEFAEITEDEEEERKEKIKTKWAALEALVGDPKRIEVIAKDLVQHFDRRTDAMDGKAMIVCMSRRICVDLYNAIIELRPDWQDEDDRSGCIKIVMTGSASDKPQWQQHIRNKARRRELAGRFKKPDISILSDEFLEEVKGLKHKNLAAELLRKLLSDEIKTRSKRNVVQSRIFSEMLKEALLAYQNRAIATHEIIEELIKPAKEIRDASRRGDRVGGREPNGGVYPKGDCS